MADRSAVATSCRRRLRAEAPRRRVRSCAGISNAALPPGTPKKCLMPRSARRAASRRPRLRGPPAAAAAAAAASALARRTDEKVRLSVTLRSRMGAASSARSLSRRRLAGRGLRAAAEGGVVARGKRRRRRRQRRRERRQSFPASPAGPTSVGAIPGPGPPCRASFARRWSPGSTVRRPWPSLPASQTRWIAFLRRKCGVIALIQR